MPKVKKVKLGAVKGVVKLFDTADRAFTLKNGVVVNLVANTPLEVTEVVAKELLKEYPYLKVV